MKRYALLPLLAGFVFPALSLADSVSLDTTHTSSLTATAAVLSPPTVNSNSDNITSINFDNSGAGTTHAVQDDWSASTRATLTPDGFTFELGETRMPTPNKDGSAESDAAVYFTPNTDITYSLAANITAGGQGFLFSSNVTLKDETTSAILYETTIDGPENTAALPSSGADVSGSLTGSLVSTDIYSITLMQSLIGLDPSADSTYTLDFAAASSVPLPTSAASFFILIPLIAAAKYRRQLSSAL